MIRIVAATVALPKQRTRKDKQVLEVESTGIHVRPLVRHEVTRIWEIDRSEVIENIYYLRGGKLLLEPEHCEMMGWPPGEPELYTPILLDCFDRGGTFDGAFAEANIVGVMVLETKFIGPESDQLQLMLLHVSRGTRKQGLGRHLFERAVGRARRLGARSLYISATPSENTVRFYMGLGCVLAGHVDPVLHELEPEDIHLEFRITGAS
jgi:predicted N-acetyltransferase YhbS